MKFSIDWHKECLANWLANTNRDRERIEEELTRLRVQEDRIRFYQHQIEQAEKKGKPDFDRERFCCKRGKGKK